MTEPAVARPGRWPRWLARAWRWWAARPALAPRRSTPPLSLVFVGQGLLPGRTLSNADMLWSTPPWTAAAPPEVRYGGANFELADTVVVFLPFFEHAREVAAGRAAVESARHGRPARSWPTPSRRSSRPSPCPPACCRSGRRWR